MRKKVKYRPIYKRNYRRNNHNGKKKKEKEKEEKIMKLEKDSDGKIKLIKLLVNIPS